MNYIKTFNVYLKETIIPTGFIKPDGSILYSEAYKHDDVANNYICNKDLINEYNNWRCKNKFKHCSKKDFLVIELHYILISKLENIYYVIYNPFRLSGKQKEYLLMNFKIQE